jgi:hypothetical protein
MLEISPTRHTDSAADTAAAAMRGRATFLTGVYTGALLVVVMLAALVAANRLPALEPYAFERNAASYTLFVLVMMIPVLKFRNRSLPMFLSAMLGWVLFVAAYDIAGMVFHNLFHVLRTPFEALIEGSIVYGVLAVASWVVRMVSLACREPIQPRRRRTDHILPHQH